MYKSILVAGLHDDRLLGLSRLGAASAGDEESERLLREAFAIKLGRSLLEKGCESDPTSEPKPRADFISTYT
jgi:hypothetical protein